MEEIKDAMQQFLVSLKETETYRNYERYKELLAKGQTDVKYEDVLAEMNERDTNDSTRAIRW